jgi:hypothetical protein
MAESGLQARTLQEQSPGACMQMPCQKQNEDQFGCHHSQCQLVDGKLASANKAKAICQRESLIPGMSNKTTFCKATVALLEPSHKASQNSKN